MREIKFRAWDKENETIVYPKGILFDGRIVNFSCGMLEAFKGYEITQYTGLKDRHGKEIYEGDIVLAQGEYDITPVKGQVYWNYGAWEVNLYRFKELNNVEVIGNIHENPELLEDANN